MSTDLRISCRLRRAHGRPSPEWASAIARPPHRLHSARPRSARPDSLIDLRAAALWGAGHAARRRGSQAAPVRGRTAGHACPGASRTGSRQRGETGLHAHSGRRRLPGTGLRPGGRCPCCAAPGARAACRFTACLGIVQPGAEASRDLHLHGPWPAHGSGYLYSGRGQRQQSVAQHASRSWFRLGGGSPS
jgi:hypothetical protein